MRSAPVIALAAAFAHVLARLARAGINCVASNGCASAGGTFGMVIFVKPGDLSAAETILTA